jgi:hypothetical protein
LQPAGDKAVQALFVFYLPEGHAERVAELGLGHSEHHAAQAHAGADLFVDQVGPLGPAAAGVNRSTLLRAIKAGRISGQRDATGRWEIEPAEFHRVFPPLSLLTQQHDPQQADALVALLRNLLEQMRNDMAAKDNDHRRRRRRLPAGR